MLETPEKQQARHIKEKRALIWRIILAYSKMLLLTAVLFVALLHFAGHPFTSAACILIGMLLMAWLVKQGI